MSNDSLTNHVPVTPITIPSLNVAGYASGLDDAFEKINDNFSILANHEFIKGDSGRSVEVVSAKFFNEDGTLNIYGQKFQECIMALANVSHPDSIPTITVGDVTLSVWDNFTKETAGTFQLVNSVNDVTGDATPVSSLYYVFLDGRFANTTVGKVDPSKYDDDGIEDLSCIIVYKADKPSTIGGTGGFVAMTNAFPTMYYERGLGLCWKVNGNMTGIPVQGIPGVDGKDSVVNIVKCQSVTNNNRLISGEVVGIYESFDGYVPIAQVESIAEYDNTSALVLTPVGDGSNGSNFYFGSLRIENDKLIAVCNQETAINYGVEEETIINAMKNIDILNNGSENASSGIKGLFIPMKDEFNGVQPVHLLSATSITNTEGQASDLKADMIFTPIDDINSLTINEEKQLKVEKYLYVKVDKNANFIKNCSNLFTTLDAHGYALKYKLTTVIKNLYDTNDNTRLNRYFDTYNENSTTGGSRFFSIDDVNIGGGLGSLNDSNTMYYSSETIGVDNVNAIKSADVVAGNIMSMPAEFVDRMTNTTNNTGIYRWELCSEKAEYDVDELLAYEGDSYDFPVPFNVIYTTSVTPNVTTDFMWFNGLEVVSDSNSHYGIDNNNNNGLNAIEGKYYIYGWNYGTNNPVFKFIKFVPIYDTDFIVKDDTTFNINYNVNITGDLNEPTKNLTVHGSVNCDNINVYKLTATGEIKNIYTKDTIVGDSGIKLGLNNETNEHNVNISDDGEISTNKGITTKYISCFDPETNSEAFGAIEMYTIKADNLKARQTVTNELFIDNASSERRVFIGDNAVGSENEQYNFELHKFGAVEIERNDNTNIIGSGDNALQPVLRSDMPVIQRNASNIIVTNQDKDGTNLPYYGVNRDNDDNSNHDAGEGVSSNEYMGDIKFENVKNFNINRLSLNKISTTKQAGTYTLTTKSFNGDLTANPILQETVSGAWSSVSKTSNPTISTDYLYKIELKRSDANEKFNRSNNLSIEFNNTFMMWIGLSGKCDNGRWPILYSDSRMYLDFYYTVSGDSEEKLVFSKEFTIDYATGSTSNDSGYEWCGYDANGNHLGGSYGYQWRYYPFYFRPSKMELNSTTSMTWLSNLSAKRRAFADIADNFDLGRTITIYIVPRIHLYAKGQKNIWGNEKSIINGLFASRPVALTTKTDTSSVLVRGSDLNPARASNAESTISISFYKNVSDSSNNVNSTIVCEDGIVMRSGDYTFGLGYCDTIVDHELAKYNKTHSYDPHWSVTDSSYYTSGPVLFYHKMNNDYYESNGKPRLGNSKEAYSRRTDAIPLKDIFNVIRYARSNANWEFGL